MHSFALQLINQVTKTINEKKTQEKETIVYNFFGLTIWKFQLLTCGIFSSFIKIHDMV